MTPHLTITQAGPALSVQDQGRAGFRAQGLTVGGAADRTALFEGAALLGQSPTHAAIEMAGSGGSFTSDADIRIALCGAEMAAKIDGEPLVWGASHLLTAGATLTIGGARNGSYGYLHVGGGFATPKVMGAQGSHLAGGIGALLTTGDTLPIGPDVAQEVAMTLPKPDRFGGGKIRIVQSMQTATFDAQTIDRFTATKFRRDARANRMGVRMEHDGAGFATAAQLSILSEVVVPGDIQIAGDGAPYVLMYECQTTGGYPRIGSVLPCDLPRVAQAQTGAFLTFEFVGMDEAVALQARYLAGLKALASHVTPLVRDPATMRDLLRYQMISGAVSAVANPFEQES
ncbi:urea amidolyase [Sulfitobacter sp. M57]|uniref:5-oxoprolinase subunit C family protein n=1 Tax=unclassified Sulfitobacter TaxID=196795 RepID=UPI0023E2095B|nr:MULTISPECIES: urea amidolyase [unclassified Sulfitobacter]MDF3414746.1 urea amidolyase [Sulfitobacter sp. KE5]MDF3422227.1 urea amidolyase [Sulfitobacter sp. KE43]MDF3433292.1 urea amidolyase [Sulfitobacter sp. KE42]MDF3458932.1 urea amidolyase [Sulfitobacter sp. S74]MDF3462831.1 urea amidolyase [Sulfitobacter sp. Ks18]